MEDVEILGVIIGECENLQTILGSNYVIFCNFSPNETMYKIFPDFPTEFSKENELVFRFLNGNICFNENIYDFGRWGTIYEKYIWLNHFKGEDNA